MIEPKRTNLDWLKEQVSHNGDDCLIWPFARSRGYGMLSDGNKKIRKAHRVLCEMVHGLPPTPEHEAAHSCGNGHGGCVNPKHLSWKTRSENQRDRRAHGTHRTCPPGASRFKLTAPDVAEIRLRQGSATVADLAQKFGVTRSTIRQIHLNKIWVNGVRGRSGFKIGDMRNPSVNGTRGHR